MDTDTLYSALSEKELYDCIREKSKVEWEILRTEDCKNDFTANATTIFFPRTCCTEHKIYDERKLALFKEEFLCTAMLCLWKERYCCDDSNTNKYKFSCNGLNKRTLGDCDDGPMAKYWKVVDEFFNVTSTSRCFRTFHHSAATYQLTKKDFLTFIQRELLTLMAFTIVLRTYKPFYFA